MFTKTGRWLIFYFLLVTGVKAQEPKLVLNIGNTFVVKRAVFSPDSKRIITADEFGAAKLWDAPTGILLADFNQLASDGVIIFSPDGKQMVIGTGDSSVVFSSLTGLPLFKIKGNPFYNPDGKHLIFFDPHHPAIVWNVADGKSISGLSSEYSKTNPSLVAQMAARMESQQYTCRAISSDGLHVVTGEEKGILKIWELHTGALVRSFKEQHNRRVNSLAFSPDGQQVISSSADGAVKIWDWKNGTLISTLGDHHAEMRNARFCLHGTGAIAACTDSTVTIWNLKSGKTVKHFRGVSGAEFSPDEKLLVVNSSDAPATILETQHWKTIRTLHKASLVIFSPDSKNILGVANYADPQIWDVATGMMLADLGGHVKEPLKMIISPDGKKQLTFSDDSLVRVWNTLTQTLLFSLRQKGYNILDAAFSAGSSQIITASADGVMSTWDAGTGLRIRASRMPFRFDNNMAFSADLQALAVISPDSVKIWDTETGKQVSEIYSGQEKLYRVFLSQDKKTLAGETVKYNAKTWDVKTGELTAGFSASDGDRWYNKVFLSGFSGESGKLLVARDSYLSTLYNINTKQAIFNLHQDNPVRFAAFSPDQTIMVTTGTDDSLKIWNTQTGALANKIKNGSRFWSIIFSNDGKKIILASQEKAYNTWELASGRLLSKLYVIDSVDFINKIPNGYYMASTAGAKRLNYINAGLEPVTFEQLDVRYNRPDLVLSAIGCTDTALIRAYHAAYEKRVKRLGIDTNGFRSGYSAPKADFINRDQHVPENGIVKIKVTASDEHFALDRFNVWINHVPDYGKDGISLKKKGRRKLDTTVTVQLSIGLNRLETSVTNVNGTESYHVPFFLDYQPAVNKDSGKFYFVGIGISRFADRHYDLRWSVKDMRDLARAFKSRYGKNARIDTLFDKQVNLSNVRALKARLRGTGVNDKVVIAYSGHGLLTSSYAYYLSAYNVNFEKPQENGIPYENLEDLLDSIPARRKLLLIDACHSGDLDTSDIQGYLKSGIASGSKGRIWHKPLPASGMTATGNMDLMKSLFVDVSKGTGATIIAASGGLQAAQEQNKLGNGIFTFSILEYLKAHARIQVSGLKTYVNKKVTELSFGSQKPSTRSENYQLDWYL
ncbi:MAG: caspase family protein [Bacteroidota bacterium]|nr:caspase family protein [Bacteroidota bacterium]